MIPNVLVYISGPMTAKNGYSIEENVAAGVKVFIELLQENIPAYSPHLSGAFPSCWTAIDWTKWLEYDCRIIDRCTHVLMMPRWKESSGAQHEYEYAMKRDKLIAFSIEELRGML